MFKLSDLLFFHILFPLSDDPKSVLQWRWAVSITLAILLVVNTAGFVSTYVMPSQFGFVTQNQFTQMQSRVDTIIRVNLEENINRTKTRQCTAIAMRNQEALDQANRDLNEYQYEYFKLFNRYYAVLTCNELLAPPGTP